MFDWEKIADYMDSRSWSELFYNFMKWCAKCVIFLAAFKYIVN